MSGAAGLGWIVAVAAWTILVLGRGDIAGFAARDVATFLGLSAIALWLTGWASERSRGGWRATIGAVAVWGCLVGSLSATFLYRDALLEAARSIGQDIGLGAPEAVVGQGGEVAVTRRADGTFAVPARIGDHEVRFLFDTGASAVVLSTETARLIGHPPETLSFRVPVSTANGRGLAAPIVLDRLAVGPIVMRRVPALVAKEGMLEGNLLGQTFLNKLESYEVRGNRLVFRAGRA